MIITLLEKWLLARCRGRDFPLSVAGEDALRERVRRTTGKGNLSNRTPQALAYKAPKHKMRTSVHCHGLECVVCPHRGAQVKSYAGKGSSQWIEERQVRYS